MAFVEEVLKSFVILFVIMDPFASLPVFISLTKKFGEREKLKSANEAAVVAGVLILVFLFFGSQILSLLRISLPSLLIAGGFILGIMGLQLVLRMSIAREKASNYNVAGIIIGTPLITGPGVISTTIILVQQHGYLTPLIAALLALLVVWLILRNAQRICNALGQNVIEVISRIMGILLVAIAIEFIKNGVTAFVLGIA